MIYFNPEDNKKPMVRKLQKGIHYRKEHPLVKSEPSPQKQKPIRNDSFAILFLRVAEGFKASQVGQSIQKLWKLYQALEKGDMRDLPNCPVPAGKLSVLIGYGPNIFKLSDVRKKLPNDLKDRQFLPPGKEGGGPILQGSGIQYANDVHENLGTSEHIVVQFISNTQLATYRAIVETRKYLCYNDVEKEPLHFTRFYTGFQRDDGRSWLGFHDELSNMRSIKEREEAIVIDELNNNLRPRDFWTKYGTYLAFLRIGIDLDIWQRIERKHQELIVGRDKLTGCPLVGVDKKGNPIIKEGCPIRLGTDADNARIGDHPDFFKEPAVSAEVKATLDVNAAFKILNQSHIGRTRHIDGISSKKPTSRRIFRQSFEFLEPLNNPIRPFRAGLNFVSFQNDPGRLFFILTDPNWLGNANFGGDPDDTQGMDKLLSVLAAGVFLVPPVEKPFPGASILV
jgi:deferrochelatase/peroxidase EfeB